jgi:hypothetical protein
VKTQKRPPETASKLGEFSVEVSCSITARYRLVSQSVASHVVFEGDFWGETIVEFSHSLGQKPPFASGLFASGVAIHDFSTIL